MSVKILQAGDAAAAPVAAPPVPAPAPTPSETVVRAAQLTGSCSGPSGSTYAFRKLGPLDRMLIAKAVGSELMQNGLYASYALVACSVSEINGEKLAMPSSTRQVEFRVQRIGDDWEALNAAMRVAFNPWTESENEGEGDGDGDDE